MNTGTFLCSCAGTCDIDLERAREGVSGVDVAASSSLLCGDGRDAMEGVIEEYDLDQLIVTCPDPGVQRELRSVATAHGLHPDAVEFVDQREGAGWVHEEAAATDKTARLVNAANAGLEHESPAQSHTAEAGESVAVVGDPETAVALAERADVTLVADGQELAGEAGLGSVTVERGRVVDVAGQFGEFTLTLESRVTEDCISCMECVRRAPDGAATRFPVDIDPDASDGGSGSGTSGTSSGGSPDGEWTDCCPTDAIEMDGHRRELEFDQVVYPGGPGDTRSGRIGLYTGVVDAGTVAAVESLLGGYDGPDHLELAMEVCASGSANQQGCTACTDACPHGAIERPRPDEVAFAKEACRNCGACTSVCPTGAVTLREPSNERLAREVEALLAPTGDDGGLVSGLLGGDEAGIGTPVVAFVCSERAAEALSEYGRRGAAGEDVEYPPILPVHVTCTDTVGEAHVMHALACGADGVAIVGCGGDCLHSGPEPKADLVERLNRATGDLGLGERVGFFAADPERPAAFVEDVSRFVVETLDPSPVPVGEHEATGRIDADGNTAGATMSDGGPATRLRDDPDQGFATHDWTLESVRAILAHVQPDRDVVRGLETFANVAVSDDCTLTPTCSNLCPTDALRRDGPLLEFSHERCVNCGLCAEGCMEDAIDLTPGLHLDLLPENRDGDPWRRAFEGEMRECKHCGKPFTSEGSASKIQSAVGDQVAGLAPDGESVFEYCAECRALLLYKRDEMESDG